jgi:hypothetical protein
LGFPLPAAILWHSYEVPVGVWDAAGYDLGGFIAVTTKGVVAT